MAVHRLHNDDWGVETNCFVCEPTNDRGLRIPFWHDDERDVVTAEFELADHFGGQLGLGTRSETSIAVPAAVDVPPLQRLGLGSEHSCAIDLDDRLWCWGSNGSGQIAFDHLDPDGASYALEQLRPVRPPGLTAVEEVAAGTLHTCVRTATGRHRCFGLNERGQVGVETETESVWVPQPVD